MKNYLIEVCVDTFSDALSAESKGANRIELCSHLSLDGLTPTLELTKKTLSALKIPVHVMIRPRSINFQYLPHEIETMIETIYAYKKLGIKGIVFGALLVDFTIDIPTAEKIAKAAEGLNFVFHKAIDLTPNPVVATQTLAAIKGITHILTSGGAPTAEQGASVIRNMDTHSQHIKIIAAGKINDLNLTAMKELLGVTEYHGKLIVGDLKK
ncbi:MAG: copper homeostasis protein CutC [Cyclobacteriaceae bacterium]|jgi:copper homeostasis protein|nr:copper homeostasis protein CutC [Cyclobacteriaceae bacterium]